MLLYNEIVKVNQPIRKECDSTPDQKLITYMIDNVRLGLRSIEG